MDVGCGEARKIVEMPIHPRGRLGDPAFERNRVRPAEFPAELAAVAIERCYTDELGQRFGLDSSQFGQVGDQRPTGRRADSRDGLQDLIAASPPFVESDDLSQSFIEFGNLPTQHVQDGVDYLRKKFGAEVESRVVREEHVSFPLPRELRVLANN